jgi:1,4-alpha-glucan branching enzyme
MFGYMFGQPGKKLLFMGVEFGQWDEWYHEKSLDWHLLEYPPHIGVKKWVEDLNRMYRQEPALYESDLESEGFRWIDCTDVDHSVVSFLRQGKHTNDLILVVANFTPETHVNYRVGAPRAGYWQEILNGDAPIYGGSGQGNMGGLETTPIPQHGYSDSLNLILPPLATVFFKSAG